jgi:hypothetical protein
MAPTATHTPEVTQEIPWEPPEYWYEDYFYSDSYFSPNTSYTKAYYFAGRGSIAAVIYEYEGDTTQNGQAKHNELGFTFASYGPQSGYRCYYKSEIGSGVCNTYAPGATQYKQNHGIGLMEAGQFSVEYTGNHVDISWQATMRVVWRSLDVPPPTPTPATTPVVSYCSSVSGYDPIDPEPGLELPVPKVGQPSCTGIPAFQIDLSVLNWLPGVEFETLTFPGLHVCATPILFGEVRFVGVAVNLDILSLLMAGVVLIRILLRS